MKIASQLAFIKLLADSFVFFDSWRTFRHCNNCRNSGITGFNVNIKLVAKEYYKKSMLSTFSSKLSC